MLTVTQQRAEELLADDPIWIILIKMAALFAIGVLLSLFMINWECLVGRPQHRSGPKRVGPGGWLKSLADGLKLAFKEDIMRGRELASRVPDANSQAISGAGDLVQEDNPAELTAAVLTFLQR